MKDLIAAYHRRLWGSGDLTAIDEAFAADAVVHLTGFDGSAVQTVRDDASRYFGAFTAVSTSVSSLLSDGDRVVLQWSTTGTHVGPYGKVAATGRVVTMHGIDIFRVDDRRIVELWSMWDGLDVYDQLGVLPELW
jgi:predicted ester cyclase